MKIFLETLDPDMKMLLSLAIVVGRLPAVVLQEYPKRVAPREGSQILRLRNIGVPQATGPVITKAKGGYGERVQWDRREGQ